MKWKETTEAKYMEMLEVLPPAIWTRIGFLVGEPFDHNSQGRPRFEAFANVGGKFYVADQNMTVAEFRALRATDIKEAA